MTHWGFIQFIQVHLLNKWHSLYGIPLVVKPITNTAWVQARLCTLQNGALDSQPHVIKFTICLPMVGGSLRVLWFPPPLKLVAMI